MKIKRIIFLILLIITFISIFKFSSQDGEESKNVSKGFMRKIVEINPMTKNLSEKEKEQIVENSQPIIRKLAHYSIYLIAGIMIMGFTSTFDYGFKKCILLTIIIGMIYAISDELHQGFSFGRTPRMFDVCVDTLGVLTGSVIIILVTNIISKLKNKVKVI